MNVCACLCPFDNYMHAPMLGGTSKKRKHGDRIFRFKTFCSTGNPAYFGGSFQENVRTLLELGNRENDSSGVRQWSFILELHRHPPIHLSLYVVEEFIDQKSSSSHCHHCRCIGWGHHMICNRMFHFVLPSRKAMPLKEARALNSHGHCGAGDVKALLTMNLQSKLMHGVLHSNGFGHLLCINGIEGGSEIVSGHQIMELWDRICSGLQARKVSLLDTARKGAMSLRLIHGIAYGEPWFGTWGYRFGRGSFGVTEEMYHNSIEVLQSLPLCLLVPQYGSTRHEVPAIVAKYQIISGHSLLTLKHLLNLMLELKRRLPLDTLMAMDYHGIATETACRWSMKRVEMAANVIVDTLKKAGPRWVSRQDVRDSARTYVGDTGLLDFVLKSIGNHVVGSYMVRRMVNPVTKVLEYCLEDISNGSQRKELNLVPKAGAKGHLTRAQITRDLLYLYKYVLKDQNPAITTGIFDALPIAVRMTLDSKHLIKDYSAKLLELKDNNIRVPCSIHLRHDGQQAPLFPCCEELVSLPAHATIKELKKKAEDQFRNTYLGLANFVAESVVGIANDRDADLVLNLVESGGNVVIRGRIQGAAYSHEILEAGRTDWGDKDGVIVMDCQCGAKEEDGERMVCCDVCEVWQHTRCLQIPNSEDVPTVFLCRQCEQDITALASLVP